MPQKHGPHLKQIYTYSIHQLDLDANPSARDLFGSSLRELQQRGKQVDPSMYRKVFDGEVSGEAPYVLDLLWLKFNACCPKDFPGRSMSVSDIIVLGRNQKEAAYYVDTFGFQKLSRKITMEE